MVVTLPGKLASRLKSSKFLSFELTERVAFLTIEVGKAIFFVALLKTAGAIKNTGNPKQWKKTVVAPVVIRQQL